MHGLNDAMVVQGEGYGTGVNWLVANLLSILVFLDTCNWLTSCRIGVKMPVNGLQFLNFLFNHIVTGTPHLAIVTCLLIVMLV